MQHTRSMMGPYIDIPGPEISAGSRMMSWFFDEYSKYKRFSPASVTGKVSLAMPHCLILQSKNKEKQGYPPVVSKNSVVRLGFGAYLNQCTCHTL